MKIFAIGDLHLPGGDDKTMEVFGSNWNNHFERISSNWQKLVSNEDIVLIPGDISWAMMLHDAEHDLTAISKLNGQKVLIRGNHDFWWSAIGRVRSILDDNMFAIQNDAISIGSFCFCGTRGWLSPGAVGFAETSDRRIYERESKRLELSLKSADKGKRIICMLHYPPIVDMKSTVFSELVERYCVEQVVYGHLHGKSCESGFNGERNGVNYSLCSCDHLNFCPKLIAEG